MTSQYEPSGNQARLAGVAALTAAAAWLTWAVLNLATHGALDGPRAGANAALAWLGVALLVASTVLVIPAALVLARQLQGAAPRLVPVATAAGVLSMALWAGAVLTGWWPAGLEPAYVALSAVWWGGLAGPMRRAHPRLSVLTLVLAVAAVCDAVVTGGYGWLPAWTFPVLGGAKLPLQLAWTISVGVVLVRGPRHVVPVAGAGQAAA